MRTNLNTSLETNPLYWKRVKDQLEAYNTKVSSIALRKNIIIQMKWQISEEF